MKKCVLEDKICDNCGRCDNLCQLDPTKVCNNCFKCLGIDDYENQKYAEIPITGVYFQDEFMNEDHDYTDSNGFRYHFSTLAGTRGHYKKRC